MKKKLLLVKLLSLPNQLHQPQKASGKLKVAVQNVNLWNAGLRQNQRQREEEAAARQAALFAKSASPAAEGKWETQGRRPHFDHRRLQARKAGLGPNGTAVGQAITSRPANPAGKIRHTRCPLIQLQPFRP
ncbi:hypothetical protein [Mycobacterium tuberculosis]|uniref:hypothetical protein n=1 Tax=Mycobacterium tuberculosis TaxID=1773 RepID=UPI00272A68EF|nr:hypothetical protein [Mycobacterium tuberculosis]